MSRQRQIIVLGGGGFSDEPRNQRLDRYVLDAAHKANPRICFVPTASGDSPKYIQRFYRRFAKHRLVTSRDGDGSPDLIPQRA